jgi:D-xylonolactonase
MQPEVLAQTGCSMGECPRWDPDDRRLNWCDMLGGEMYCYDPDSGSPTRIYSGPNVGGFVRERGRTTLLFMEDGTVRRRFCDGAVNTLADGPESGNVRFHDAVVDPTGRVLCGTIPTDDAESVLYRLDSGGTFAKLVTDVGVANGVGLSPENDRLYLADTGRDRVDAFDYDPAEGTVGDRERIVDVTDERGSPDGLAVDEAGYVWLAITGGSRVVRYAPDGTEDRRVEFPVPTVTSVEFGGPDRRRAFVTTGTDQDAADPAPLAGALFGFDAPVAGRGRYEADVSL